MKPSKNPVYLEFKESSAHLLDGEHGAEFPMERRPDGRLTEASAELLRNGVRGFLAAHGGSETRQAIGAIPARGVTLRTIALPMSANSDPARFLAMQIEAQFPVSPSELAWGFSRPGGASGATEQSDFVVVAVKREVVEDYAAVLSSCGLVPLFTVAALARTAAVGVKDAFGVFEMGVERSELLVVDAQGAPSLRVLNWGKAHLGELADVEGLRRLLPTDLGTTLYVSSVHGPVDGVVAELRKTLRAERLPSENAGSGPGFTAATEGLRRAGKSGQQIVFLGGTGAEAKKKFAAPTQWKWAAMAAGLLLLAVSLRYAEAAFFQASLSKKLNEITAYRNKLPKVDKELSFLTFIKTNQPPYLDTVAVISGAAPAGTKFEQLSVARRGDVALRGTMQDPQGPEKFRSKLIASGFFAKVVVEEQVAIQNPRKVNFRITADLKPEGARPVLPPENPKSTNQAAAKAGARPPGARPMPPGAMPVIPTPPNR